MLLTSLAGEWCSELRYCNGPPPSPLQALRFNGASSYRHRPRCYSNVSCIRVCLLVRGGLPLCVAYRKRCTRADACAGMAPRLRTSPSSCYSFRRCCCRWWAAASVAGAVLPVWGLGSGCCCFPHPPLDPGWPPWVVEPSTSLMRDVAPALLFARVQGSTKCACHRPAFKPIAPSYDEAAITESQGMRVLYPGGGADPMTTIPSICSLSLDHLSDLTTRL